MALRAREIYYFVRMGNYASRPLKALQSDFARLGASGDAAARKLEALDLQQKRLARNIALRRANIPVMRESNLLRIQEQQAAISKAGAALDAKRTALTNQRMAAETNLDKAIERGNILEQERVALQARQLALSLRSRAAINVQAAQLASQRGTLTRAGEMIPAQRRIAEIERARALAQQRAVIGKGGLSPAQREAALGGRISRSAGIAGQQAKFLATEKAVQSANLAIQRLAASEALLAERNTILNASFTKLAAAEEQLKAATIQDDIALSKMGARATDNAVAVDKYRAEIRLLTENMQLLVAEEGRLSAAEMKLVEARLAGAAAIAKENEAMQLEVAQLARVAAEMRLVNAEQTKQRWDRISLGGRALADFGRTAQYAGGITVLALGAAARAAAGFRTKVVLAATQVGDAFGSVTNRVKQTNTVADQLEKGLIRQMRQFPASADEMAKSSYDIYSSLTLQGNATQQTAQGLKILSVFQRAAVAGQTKLSDVTNAGITILNQFGKENATAGEQVSQLNKFMDQAFSAVRFGRTTFAEFTGMLANAAPAAKAANQSFSDMAGTLAFLTRRLPVRQASVGYARLLEILQRSEEGLKSHGVNVRDNVTKQYRSLQDIIGDIRNKFPEVAKGRKSIIELFKEITKGSGAGTMGTVQARRAFVFLIQQYRQYRQILKLTTKDQGEFWKSFRALQASPEVKWKIFVNQLHALTIEIGQYAIPALVKLIEPIKQAVKWFEGLSDQQKKQIATFAVWAGGIALIAGTFAVIIGTLTRVVATLAEFSAKMSGASVEARILAGEAGSITAIMAKRLGLAAAILLMIQFHDQTKDVINALGGLKTVINILTTVYLVNMMRKWALAATVAQASAATIVAAEAEVGGASILGAAGMARFAASARLLRMDAIALLARVGPLVAALTALAAMDIIKTSIKISIDLIRGEGWNDETIGKILSLIPGYRGIGIPGTRFQLPGLGELGGKALGKLGVLPHKPQKLAEDKITKGYVTIFNGVAYRWDGKKWTIYDPKKLATQKQVAAAEKKVAEVKAQLHHNKSVQEYIALARKANAYAKAHPRDLQAQIRAAHIMSVIQKKFTGDELAGIEAVISADTAATKKRISNSKQYADEAMANMKQVYDQLLQQNQSAMGDVTQGTRVQNAIQWGAIPTSKDILGDMRQMLNKFRKWRNSLAALAKRGVPFALLQQLEAAGPEAEPLLQGIMRLTKKQFVQYVSMFQQGQRMVKTATMFDFNRQLKDWRSHGKKAAMAFIRGVEDESSYINRQMKKIFTSWLKGGNAQLTAEKTKNAPKPPPKKPPKDMSANKPRPTHGGRGGRGDTKNITIHEGHINIHDSNSDISTKYRKAKLIQKNRRANRLNWGAA